MKILKTKEWSWVDISLLRWSCIFFGMIAGAYLANFVKQYVWIFVLVALGLAIRPAFKYFGKE